MILKDTKKDKEMFVTSLLKLKKGYEERSAFSDALGKFASTYVIMEIGNDWCDALSDLLTYLVDDKDDTIAWWLFEDVDKVIYFSPNTKYNHSDKDMHFDVSTAEKLFDYFIYCEKCEKGDTYEQ